MEEEIREAVERAVVRFEGSTGFSPESIEIVMVEATTYADPGRRFGVAAVRATVEV
jgi:hypothetical protein